MLLENISRLCKERGITLAELERSLKMGNGVIAKWATRSPILDNVKKVADFFGVTVDDLMKERSRQ